MVLYESPHRLAKTIKDLGDHLGGDRKASVARELTKLHEEILRGDLQTLLTEVSAKSRKGEMVIIIQGKN